MFAFLKPRLLAPENLPSLLFFALWRTGLPLDQAAWFGALAATIVLSWLWLGKRTPDSILLGINLHFVLTPVIIQSVFSSGYPNLARTMIDHAGVGVLGAILCAGILLSCITRNGFIGAEVIDPRTTRKRSWMLILWSMLAFAWSISFAGSQFLAVGVPILSIFVMRGLLRRPVFRSSRFLPIIFVCVLRPVETTGRAIRSAFAVI